jgi:hypothetical protein
MAGCPANNAAAYLRNQAFLVFWVSQLVNIQIVGALSDHSPETGPVPAIRLDLMITALKQGNEVAPLSYDWERHLMVNYAA